jgi:anaphase-promoting complex subunit 8
MTASEPFSITPSRKLTVNSLTVGFMPWNMKIELQKIVPKDHTILAHELRKAAKECHDRGLINASKWITEMLLSMNEDVLKQSLSFIAQDYEERAKALGGLHVDTELLEIDKIKFGKALLDAKEFDRAIHVLTGCQSQKAMFIRNYAKYLSAQKAREETEHDGLGPIHRLDQAHPKIKEIERDYKKGFELNELDGFNCYLYGLACKMLGLAQKALSAFIRSIDLYQWNWSAWLEVAYSPSSAQGFHQLLTKLAQSHHIMAVCFMAHAMVDLQMIEEAVEIYEKVLYTIFPNSSYLKTQMGIAKYNLRDMEEAEEFFESVTIHDPYRLESMDYYSNVLYVKENRVKLSLLAQTAIKVDKYRPETCCIIGNYYSLRGEHEKAIVYFKRALRLNRGYIPAWTLMGHEYIELKNTFAAIEVYNRALELNPKDYRAWYGLGQAYEVMRMPVFSNYYYQQACQFHPNDGRLWCSLGFSYELLSKYDYAITCYNRAALDCPDATVFQVFAFNKLAALYRKQNDLDHAAEYYKCMIEVLDRADEETDNLWEALLFLANYYKEQGDRHEAEHYANRLLECPNPEREEAKAILREIRLLPISSSHRNNETAAY